MKIGYIRVSTQEQNLARQLEKMKSLGIEERYIFQEKQSGKDFARPVYQAMKLNLREGDELYIDSLDRLGRNYEGIMAEWREIIAAGVKINVLDMPLLSNISKDDLTGKLVSDIVLALLSYVADNERQKIKRRQAEGIEQAKKEGKYKGRQPVKFDKEEFEKLYNEVRKGERTAKYAYTKLGVSKATYYVLVNEYEDKKGRWDPKH